MKKSKLFLPALCAFIFITCTKDNYSKPTLSIQNQTTVNNGSLSPGVASGYKLYTIKAGAHYCTPNPFVFTSKNELKFNAVFDSSAIYTVIDPKNAKDINKLYGFSDCGTHHLVNSARIGWRWYNNELELLAYVHLGGVIQPGVIITTLPLRTIAKCRITCLADVYEFEVNGNIVQVPRGCSGSYTRYKLNPYFGGDETAPHEIKIAINELN
jgi:hypothetical protein